MEVINNKIDFVSSGRKTGLGVSVIKDKRLGFSYTDNIEKYKECIDKAREIAALNKPDEYSFAKKNEIKHKELYSRKLYEYTREDVCEYYENFIQNLKSTNKGINVLSSVYNRAISNRHIINSEGINLKEKSVQNTVSFGSIKLDKINYTASYADIKPLSPEKGREFGERIIELQNKKDIKTGKMQLLLNQDALGALLSGFINASCNGENVLRKNSVFVNKLESKVTSNKLSIEDNGIKQGLFNTWGFDDEGTSSQRTVLIKKGVLKNIMHNLYTASKLDEDSTGNAIRTPYSRPEIGTTNLIVREGSKKDLLPEMDYGIYVKGLMGLHTMNTMTGDFSLTVSEGHFVENGQKKYPLKNTMLSGNILGLLNCVELIGRDARHVYDISCSGTYVPSILFSEAQIVGKE
ncbi:TldD/PmbA family protein [Candidatus Woesearchaeota archaeon]|nr:TldD/PmbA family protein [Candidatus Woesearchaeota archaeon]